MEDGSRVTIIITAYAVNTINIAPLRNYLETFDLTDSGAVQDAREGGQDGPNEAEGEGAADDLAVPR